MSDEEEWRDIPGFEGCYQVSNLGKVRSIGRYVRRSCDTNPRWYPGKTLAQTLDTHGRPTVHFSAQGKRKSFQVHSLVALCFLGPKPDGLEVCHGNGDCMDNRVENLRYDTRSANQFDRVAHGNHWQANKTQCKRGHPFDSENTTRDYKGHRQCRTCIRDRSRRWQAAKRAREATL